jgi:hypothetical protein
MLRPIGAAWLTFALAAALGLGCKQKPKEEPEMSAGAMPPTTPAATAAPTPPAPPETIPPPLPPPPAPPPPSPKAAAKPESIAPCCSALHKEASTPGKDGLYQTAASSCDAIAKLVASGTTKKTAALTQLRANLRGGKLPAGCE